MESILPVLRLVLVLVLGPDIRGLTPGAILPGPALSVPLANHVTGRTHGASCPSWRLDRMPRCLLPTRLIWGIPLSNPRQIISNRNSGSCRNLSSRTVRWTMRASRTEHKHALYPPTFKIPYRDRLSFQPRVWFTTWFIY
jgi:hypothetical protein